MTTTGLPAGVADHLVRRCGRLELDTSGHGARGGAELSALYDELVAEGVLEGWVSGEIRDIVREYASPLAVSVIADVLGVPPEDAPRLEAWSEPFFYLFTAIPSTAARNAQWPSFANC